MTDEFVREDAYKLIEDAKLNGIDEIELVRRLLQWGGLNQWYRQRYSGEGAGQVRKVEIHPLGLEIITEIGARLEYYCQSNGYRWRFSNTWISRTEAENFLGVWPGYLDAIEDLYWRFGRLEDDLKREYSDNSERLKNYYSELCEEVYWLNANDRHPSLKRWRERNSSITSTIPDCLKHIRHIKQVEVSEPCYVYFLLCKGVVVYVGQTSSSWPNRIITHVKDQQKVFDDVWCLEVDRQSLNMVERRFIPEFKPIYNRTGFRKFEK